MKKLLYVLLAFIFLSVIIVATVFLITDKKPGDNTQKTESPTLLTTEAQGKETKNTESAETTSNKTAGSSSASDREETISTAPAETTAKTENHTVSEAQWKNIISGITDVSVITNNSGKNYTEQDFTKDIIRVYTPSNTDISKKETYLYKEADGTVWYYTQTQGYGWSRSKVEGSRYENMISLYDTLFGFFKNTYSIFTYDESSKAYTASFEEVGASYENIRFSFTDGRLTGASYLLSKDGVQMTVTVINIGSTSVSLPEAKEPTNKVDKQGWIDGFNITNCTFDVDGDSIGMITEKELMATTEGMTVYYALSDDGTLSGITINNNEYSEYKFGKNEKDYESTMEMYNNIVRKWLYIDFSAYYDSFVYDESMKAYVFDGTQSGEVLEATRIFESGNEKYAYAEIYFENGRITKMYAYSLWEGKINNQNTVLMYDYGTTVIEKPSVK